MLATTNHKRNNLNKDIYMVLKAETISKEGFSFSNKLISIVFSDRKMHYKPGKTIKRAVEGIAYDFLRLLFIDKSVWLFRSFRSESFTGKYVGYRPFKNVFDAFRDHGLLESRNGFFIGNPDGTGSGECTRVRPTEAFISLAATHGVTSDNFRQHFRPVQGIQLTDNDVVKVRASKRGDWLNPIKGKSLPIDFSNPDVRVISASTQRLNAYFSKHTIDGCTFEGIYRLFNQGDHLNFSYNKGGRLYAYGDYQRIRSEHRKLITINGQSVVEVDVAASHLTLLHSMLGVPLHTAFSPYDVPGVPTAVVKSFIVMTLGNGRFQSRWSVPLAKEYEENYGIKLQTAHPLADVRAKVLSHLPLLSQLPESGLSWADLQYRESLGLIGAVERLAFEYDIPALPLHDAVIVSECHKDIAKVVLVEAFRQHAGCNINVKIK